MKSPFPGMDPYLEQFWGDIHASMAVYLRDQLQPQMPPGLVVRVEEYTSVEEGHHGARRLVAPDVHVLEASRRGPRRRGGGVAVAQPFLVRLKVEPRTLRSVRIVDTTLGRRVVTAMEILSPANKLSRAGRRQYLGRRRKLLKDPRVNLVEIDLLRRGDPILLAPYEAMPPEFCQPYRISVLRAREPLSLEMYRASYRERLPMIPIPLRTKDSDAVLDLQALVDRCYAAGPGSLIDYHDELRPPVEGLDAEWVNTLLRKKSLR